MKLTATAYEPPAIDGYVFWSIMSSDATAGRAILDDAAGEAYTIATTAGDFDIPVADVKAVLYEHPHMQRRVWHAYVRDVHRAKVIYRLEELDLMLRALKASFTEDY
jgi:hypothetical protein